ncbi:MAG: UbiA family prenyltransferase [Candidatus Thermoplasmatota archaeon]|nr:UbiA family prenyltransferase [Candidatus Thermoplasmatota archaeon]
MNITGRGHIKLERELERAIIVGRKVISFLVSSSLFVALALFSVVYFSFSSLGISPDLPLLFASFLVTFSLYSINKVTDKEEDRFNSPERGKFVGDRENSLIVLSVIAYAVALLVGIFSGKILAVIALINPFLVAISYSTKITPNLPRLKDIFIVKSLSVTIGLVSSTSLLAYIYFQNPYIILFWVYFLSIKLFINAVLFDVRDVSGDKKFEIKTIPAVLGIKKTRNLLFFLNSLLIPWIGISLYLNLFVPALPILIFCIFYGYWYILRFCNPEKKFSLSYDLLVDGEWIILCIMFVFLQHFVYL